MSTSLIMGTVGALMGANAAAGASIGATGGAVCDSVREGSAKITNTTVKAFKTGTEKCVKGCENYCSRLLRITLHAVYGIGGFLVQKSIEHNPETFGLEVASYGSIALMAASVYGMLHTAWTNPISEVKQARAEVACLTAENAALKQDKELISEKLKISEEACKQLQTEKMKEARDCASSKAETNRLREQLASRDEELKSTDEQHTRLQETINTLRLTPTPSSNSLDLADVKDMIMQCDPELINDINNSIK